MWEIYFLVISGLYLSIDGIRVITEKRKINYDKNRFLRYLSEEKRIKLTRLLGYHSLFFGLSAILIVVIIDILDSKPLFVFLIIIILTKSIWFYYKFMKITR